MTPEEKAEIKKDIQTKIELLNKRVDELAKEICSKVVV